MFVFYFSTLDIPIKFMEQGTMHFEAPSGLTSFSIVLDFQARFLHHATHMEKPPSTMM
jgi:hypothetical protein